MGTRVSILKLKSNFKTNYIRSVSDDIYEFQKDVRASSPTNTLSIYGPQSMYGGLDQAGLPRTMSGTPSMYRQSVFPNNFGYNTYPQQSQSMLAPPLTPQPAPSMYGGFDPRMSMNFSQYGYQQPPPHPQHSPYSYPINQTPPEYPFDTPSSQEYPSSYDIEIEIRSIIGKSDLDNITKKTIRNDLADKFGNDAVNGRKSEINSIIDDVRKLFKMISLYLTVIIGINDYLKILLK